MTDRKPLIFLIIRYTLAWLLLCLILTDVIGENVYLKHVWELGMSINVRMAEYVEDIKEKLHNKPYLALTDKTEMDYYLQRLNAFAVSWYDDSEKNQNCCIFFRN